MLRLPEPEDLVAASSPHLGGRVPRNPLLRVLADPDIPPTDAALGASRHSTGTPRSGEQHADRYAERDKARPAGRSRRRGVPVGADVRPECYACPVGAVFQMLRGASPETLDHVLAASRETVAALRSILEAVEAGLDRPRPGVEHIKLS
jgi:hypothetical protein